MMSAPPLTVDWHVATRQRQTAVLVFAAVVASVVFAALVLAVQFLSIAVLATWVVIVAIARKPRVGLYVVFGVVCVFEGLSGDSMMTPGVYLNGDISQMFHLPGVIFSPLELLLLLSFGVWLVQGFVLHRIDFRSGGDLWRPMWVFGCALLVGIVRGMAQGGLMNFALWESRFLFYMVICYMLAANLVRTRRHVQTIQWLLIGGTTLFAIEGAYRRITLIDTGKMGDVMETWYAHEDVVFLGTILLFVVAQAVFGRRRWIIFGAPLLLAINGYTLLVSERRAGYIAVMVAFLGFSLVFWRVNRKAFWRLCIPLFVCTALYLPVFWNASGPLAQPARAVRSLRDPDPRDAASNLSRDIEKINIRATINANPLLGVGFGRPYLIVANGPDISWFVFWQYETHANILWLWLKMGIGGFALFFVLMGSALARATRVLRTIHDPQVRVFALTTVGGILTALTFCYVDLGLTSARIPILLGTLLGTLAVLDRVYASPRVAEA